MALRVLVITVIAGGNAIPERDMARRITPALNLNDNQTLQAV